MSYSQQNETSGRLAEVAAILAEGLQRVLARQSSALSKDFGESSLHSSLAQSVHGAVSENEERI